MARQRTSIYTYALLSGLVGWIWVLSIPVTIGLIIYAMAFGGSWMWALYAFIVGAVAKWAMRGFVDNRHRVQIEQHLMGLGCTQDEADDVWRRAYAAGGRRGALLLLHIEHKRELAAVPEG